MPSTEFPEIAEGMETKVCCAYNMATGSSISTKVGVADLALQPLRALKMLMDGLALDGVSSLWLRALPGPPLMMRIFPFDLVYLDEQQRVIEAVELAPGVPFPDYTIEVASALILPLRTLASARVKKGDQLIICAPEEIDLRIAAVAARQEPSEPAVSLDLEPTRAVTAEEPTAPEVPQIPIAKAIPAVKNSVPDQRVPLPTNTVSPGVGFTVSLAAAWQLSSSTMAAPAVLPEVGDQVTAKDGIAIVEVPEHEIASKGSVAVPEVPVEEPEVAHEATTETEIGQDLPVVIAPVEVVRIEAAPLETATVEQATLVTAPRLTNEPAENPVPTSSPNPQFSLTFDQLCEVVAAAESVEPQEMAPAEQGPIEDDRIARSREAWEKRTLKPARANVTSPARPKKKMPEPKKDALGTRVIRWLNLEDPLPERRKIIRLLLEGLEAYETKGDHRRYDLRDICPTGFCLRTQGKWKPGQLVSLMVIKKGSDERNTLNRVRIRARVVRCDEDGVGFEFVLPKRTEFKPWDRVKTKRSDETEAEFILRELRLAHALGFLRRLCPGAAEQVEHAFHERLSNKRIASAIEITLLAEDALARGGQIELACAHSDTVMRIIEGGSWIEEDWIRRLWAGMLVSSCTADGLDTSNQQFIDLLAKLTPLHLRILSFACVKAAEALAAGQPAKEFSLNCSAEELMEIADSHSFARIQQTVGHLATYGLFGDIKRPSYLTVTEKSKTRLSPTAMGLKMWARCNGQRA